MSQETIVSKETCIVWEYSERQKLTTLTITFENGWCLNYSAVHILSFHVVTSPLVTRCSNDCSTLKIMSKIAVISSKLSRAWTMF